MSAEEENRLDDLKEIEAALASLVPRGDRLSRDRLMFLAGQASVGGRTGAMATPGTDRRLVAPCTPRRNMPTTSVGMAPARGARWAWPSAFAAMSAAAATLLVALLVRPETGSGNRIADASTPGQPPAEQAAVADRPPDSRLQTPASSLRTPDSVLSTHPEGTALRFPRSRDSYHELLARVLDRGLDAWKPPAGSGVTVTAAAPATYRELLESLLDNS
jgi:hypothetical protein